MSALTFVVAALATFRLTRMVTTDDLPVFARPREALLRRWTRGKASSWKADGLTCPWCVGFWVSAIVVAVLEATGSVPRPGLVLLALSTTVGLLAKADG